MHGAGHSFGLKVQAKGNQSRLPILFQFLVKPSEGPPHLSSFVWLCRLFWLLNRQPPTANRHKVRELQGPASNCLPSDPPASNLPLAKDRSDELSKRPVLAWVVYPAVVLPFETSAGFYRTVVESSSCLCPSLLRGPLSNGLGKLRGATSLRRFHLFTDLFQPCCCSFLGIPGS